MIPGLVTHLNQEQLDQEITNGAGLFWHDLLSGNTFEYAMSKSRAQLEGYPMFSLLLVMARAAVSSNAEAERVFSRWKNSTVSFICAATDNRFKINNLTSNR